MTTLRPGDEAPAFSLKDQHEQNVALSDFRGRKLLIYFYPEADTPGCTRQSCAVRDARQDPAGIGVDAVGISPDPPDAQSAFDEKFSLGFPLLSDPDHVVAEAYGAWDEDAVDADTRGDIIRSSFLIDEDGRVVEAWYRVAPEETVPEARRALGTLTA
jgi:thioredoxin-dependent peroxiredoxin